MPRRRDRKQHLREKEAGADEIGFVYLIKSGRYYKIGRSNSSGRREYELAIQLPERASKVHEIRTTIRLASKHIGTTGLNRNEKTANGLISARSKSNAFRRRKFM